jgi:hypothetical protein
LGRRFAAPPLPRAMTASSYMWDFLAYARMLSTTAPGIPLGGPALASPGRNSYWLTALIGGAGRRLGVLTAHRYPYSACAGRRSRSYPTVSRLLSENATTGMAETVRKGVRLAHRARLPFRLTELNSVTCRGRRGVSDTFATALWAPDALFALLRSGVDGVNVHIRSSAVNAAFALTDRGLAPRPLLYGLLMFARTLGPGSRLLDVRLRASHSLHLKAWAVRVQGGLLHVLLIDKGRTSARVVIRLPSSGAATIQRMLAPSAWSRSDVTLEGKQLGADGSWGGPPVTETSKPRHGGYDVTVPRFSAALVTVPLAPAGGGQLNSGVLQLGRMSGSPALTWSAKRGLRFSRKEVTPSTASADWPR